MVDTDNAVPVNQLHSLHSFLPEQEISTTQLAHFLWLVSQTKRFKNVTVQAVESEQGWALSCLFEGRQMVSAITLSGISLDRARYLQYYDLRVGDEFSEEKHKASVEKFKHALLQKGYKNVETTDRVEYDEITKTVKIQLVCKKGGKFTINKSSVEMVDGPPASVGALQTKLTEKFAKSLKKHLYDEELILKKTREMNEYLRKKGFLKNTLSLQEHVDHDKKQIELIFKVALGEQHSFSFIGNHVFSESQLLEMILKFGDSVVLVPSSLLAQDINESYWKKGYWNTTIETREQGNERYFVIDEGKRISIKEVLVRGTQQKFERQVHRLFDPIKRTAFFDASQVKKTLEKVVEFYHKQGCWDVQILKKVYEPITPTTSRLVVSIEEGPQRMLGTLSVEGHEALGHKLPFISRSRFAGTSVPFDKNLFALHHRWLLDHFKKQGFEQVQVAPLFDEKDSVVNVTWTVTTGQPVMCGKVIIAGYSQVKPQVLHDIVDIKQEVPFKKDLVNDAYTRLRSADVFKHIRIYSESSTFDPLHKNLIVQVQDEEPFELRTRVGFQQISKNFAIKKGSTYKAGCTFLWRNPTRHADEMWIDFDVTRFERKLDIAYQMPTFFHTPLSVLVKGYANKYTQPLTHGSRKSLYQVTQEGMLVSVSKKFERLSSGVNVGFEWMETKDLSADLAAAINFRTDLIGKKVPYFFIEPHMFFDMLDDKVNPRKGMFSVATIKGMFPMGQQSSYSVKLLVEHGMFYPLLKDHDIIGAARIRFGHILRETFSKIMPPERFYLGGSNSIRGYLPDACPPLGTYTDDANVVQRVPQGGKSMVNGNFEVRIPFSKEFGCVIFQDFGALSEDLSQINTGQSSLAATGFGIRYQTPIGPLRFDIGWKWKKPFPEDTRYAWFLTFGHAF